MGVIFTQKEEQRMLAEAFFPGFARLGNGFAKRRGSERLAPGQ